MHWFENEQEEKRDYLLSSFAASVAPTKKGDMYYRSAEEESSHLICLPSATITLLITMTVCFNYFSLLILFYAIFFRKESSAKL